MLPIRYLGQEPLFHTPNLTIRGLGIREQMPSCFIRRPNGTGDYLFMLFHDSVELGENEAVFEAGTAVLWDKGMPHYYGNPRKPWSHSWIHCDGSSIHRILRDAKVYCGKPIPNSSASNRHLLDIHEELTGHRKPNLVIIRNTLENFVQQAIRPQNPVTATPAGLLAAHEIIQTRYDEPLALETLARHAGLSQAHFCTEFRRHFGVPPIACLVHRRIDAAAALLEGTDLGIGEIGNRVGYDDPFYFSKLFKTYRGISPSHFRNQHGQAPRLPHSRR